MNAVPQERRTSRRVTSFALYGDPAVGIIAATLMIMAAIAGARSLDRDFWTFRESSRAFLVGENPYELERRPGAVLNLNAPVTIALMSWIARPSPLIGQCLWL